MYDPQLGRFLQRDPFPGRSIDPLSLNRFTYTNNNATSTIDPSGLFTIELRYISLGRVSIGPYTSDEYHHAFVYVRDADVDVTEYYFTAGPSGAYDPLAVVAGLDTGGQLRAAGGLLLPGTEEYGEPIAHVQVIVPENGQVFAGSNKSRILFDYVKRINAAKLAYNATERNSNSFAFEAIEELGLQRPTPERWAPGWDTRLLPLLPGVACMPSPDTPTCNS